jgi:hypothetical protein
MNRDQRRHPNKEQDTPKPEDEQKLLEPSRPDEEQSVRAKSSRHKKVTADKWNQ